MKNINKKEIALKTKNTVEARAGLDLPQTVAPEMVPLINATANLMNIFSNCSNRVINMLCNGTSTLMSPVGEILKGQTAEIQLANQSIYAKLAISKEINMRKLLGYVALDFNEKEQNGEEIPETFQDSDNLLLIQDNASTTSDEDFLKLWAKLYTTEACKNGSISRKAIKLCETLDVNVVTMLENDIFPYCDEVGFYWGDPDKNLIKLLKGIDYGFVNEADLIRFPIDINVPIILNFNDINVFIHQYYQIKPPKSTYILTSPAKEIKNCLQIKTTQKIIDEIAEGLTQSTKRWSIYEKYKSKIIIKNTVKNDNLFVICRNNNVIFPTDKPYKNFGEFQEYTKANIQLIEDGQQASSL